MKLFFSLILLSSSCFSRDLFVVSGPRSQKQKVERIAQKIAKEEPFTKNLIEIFYEQECVARKDSILHVCVQDKGDHQIVHVNRKILNRIFGEIKKEELSKESPSI